jgi:hypothetical protein
MSHLAVGTGLEIISTQRPFSNFQYALDRFGESAPIRRLLSQARSRGFKSLIVETVPPEGDVLAEISELESLCREYSMLELLRLSFWDSEICKESELDLVPDESCIGYAILKHDKCIQPWDGGDYDRWHVFESVLKPYPHRHNFLPTKRIFKFRLDCRQVPVAGALYCQQNGLNKSCAHVALRSLLASYPSVGRVPYFAINAVAFADQDQICPWQGLEPKQMENVLRHFGVSFAGIYFGEQLSAEQTLPYAKLLYGGIESGYGALLGFSLDGPRAEGNHIIPMFGHTFNEDNWGPNANVDYFNVGNDIRYISSESWMSSFIGHDDNFGSNFCIPQNYVAPKLVKYALSLLPPKYVNPPIWAEVTGASLFYSILPQTPESPSWLRILKLFVGMRKVILRCLSCTGQSYADHLEQMEDWDGKVELNPAIIEIIRKELHDRLWMIEISIPDLFSTNQRKLGEILISDAVGDLTNPYEAFVMARLPGNYVFVNNPLDTEAPQFQCFSNSLLSHVRVMTRQSG